MPEMSVIPTGSVGLDLALGVGRPAARAGHRDLRAGVVGEDHPHPAGHRPGPEGRRRVRLHRRRARARHLLRPAAGREGRGAAHLAARPRRAGAGDRRPPGRHRRGRPDRRRLGRRPGPQGGDRGRDGRRPHGPAGPPDEPGPAQADRGHRPEQHRGHLHQSASPEDRRGVRQPGDDHRRERAQVLRQRPAGHPQDGGGEERRGRDRHQGPGEGGQEQVRAALPRVRVRDHVRRRRELGRARSSIWASRPA